MEEREIIKQMEEKRKIPLEVKNEIMSKIWECVLSAIIVYTYFIFVNLGIRNIHQDILLTDLKVFSVSLAVVAVMMLETAYRKKEIKNLYRGIEVLGLAIITMLLQYIILYLTPKYRIMVPIFAVIYNVYFVLKALFLIYKTKSNYMKNLSDIKEIVTKERKL